MDNGEHLQDLDEALRQLVERERIHCLWFLRTDYYPATTQQIVRVLTYIERYGSRAAFVEARKIRQWLLHPSNGKSASS